MFRRIAPNPRPKIRAVNVFDGLANRGGREKHVSITPEIGKSASLGN